MLPIEEMVIEAPRLRTYKGNILHFTVTLGEQTIREEVPEYVLRAIVMGGCYGVTERYFYSQFRAYNNKLWC